jgi:poly(3-hydroxybutyrate) depolymerase
MIYQAYQAQVDILGPTRALSGMVAAALGGPAHEAPRNPVLRNVAALNQLLAQVRLTHRRPAFGIDTVRVGNQEVAVTEEPVQIRPFGTLLRFKKDIQAEQTKVLLVAPMSGHFATLLRGTVKTMLPDHDVYITDWHNARDVPLSAGDFDFDDFIDHVIAFLEHLGPGAHVVAVCQPAVAVLAAVALMAASGSPAQPRSMTLMAGPIDTRINPTKVDELAMQHSIDWFQANLIYRVPPGHAGTSREVYPGFLQLSAFMAMNMERHIRAFARQFENLVDGDDKATSAHRAFYDEYFAVMDLSAAFYLQTVSRIFQQHELARGVLVSRGRPVNPAAIRRTALLTVEGENDDICAIGQTLAAQELCTGLHPLRKQHHLQTGVGHYGVFSGRRWATEVYPRVRTLIQSSN